MKAQWWILMVCLAAVGCGGLPPDDIEVKQSALTNFDYAFHFAPVHIQDVNKKSGTGQNGRSDYITAFDYDGDLLGDNNWDHLEGNTFPLTAHMSFSISESTSHRFIFYEAYHPRDWCAGTCQEHENDSEGCLMLVRKDATQFGTLEAVVTVFHTEWRSYKVASWIGRGPNNPDNPPAILFQNVNGVLHPLTYQEPQGHGFIGCTTTSNCIRPDDGIRYVPSTVAQTPPDTIPDGVQVNVNYSLVDFATVVSHRYDRPVLSHPNSYAGDSSGTCGDGLSTCADDTANPIWAHSDTRTGFDDNNLVGEDPATFAAGWFTFGSMPVPSTTYLSLPFLHQKCETGRRLQGSSDTCAQQVCVSDSFCCNNSWDAICVSEVTSICGLQCLPPTPPTCQQNICVVQSGPIGTGCDSLCAKQVCAVDPFCCGTQWDNFCVGEVTTVCHLGC